MSAFGDFSFFAQSVLEQELTEQHAIRSTFLKNVKYLQLYTLDLIKEICQVFCTKRYFLMWAFECEANDCMHEGSGSKSKTFFQAQMSQQ